MGTLSREDSAMRDVKRPKWWMLDALVVLMVALFALEHHQHLSVGWHHLALLLIALAIFGLAAFWARIYRGALLEDDWMNEAATDQRRRRISRDGRYKVSTAIRFK